MAMTLRFLSVILPMPEVQEEIKSASVTNTSESNKSNIKEPGKRSFVPQPEFNNPNFDFKEELGRLPSLLT